VHAGVLPATLEADEAFYVAAEFLSRPGIFGLIMAALTAALMSTIDTLITAVAAIVVNDVYKPYIRRDATERQLLGAARLSSLGVTILAVLLVPVFMQFASIYKAHGAFTAAVTPPLVVTLLLSVFWRRFTRTAAVLTLVGGMAAIVTSMFVPEVIAPFAHGIPMPDGVGTGFVANLRRYSFMRAFYGLTISGIIAVVVTLLTRPEPAKQMRGLVWGTIADAVRHYKGAPGSETEGRRAPALVRLAKGEERFRAPHRLPEVRLSRALADAVGAAANDLVYIRDGRWWLGGLHSAHAVVDEVVEGTEPWIEIGAETFSALVVPSRRDKPVVVERLC
jgi:SSS family solute:Na+ symporter